MYLLNRRLLCRENDGVVVSFYVGCLLIGAPFCVGWGGDCSFYQPVICCMIM